MSKTELEARIAELERLLRCGAVVTHLGQVNLELRRSAAEELIAQGSPGVPVCATCDCPLVLPGEVTTCRTCDEFEWLAH